MFQRLCHFESIIRRFLAERIPDKENFSFIFKKAFISVTRQFNSKIV